MTTPSILPDERAPSVRRRVLVLQALVLLAVGVGLNLGVRALLQSHPEWDNPTYVAFVTQWNRLLNLDEDVQTLVLGDSSGRHGIDPRALDEALATSSINLCTIGNAAVLNAAWQLETYLREHPAPRRVILVYVYDVWPRRIALPLISRVPLRWNYWSSMRAEWEPDLGQTADLLLERYAPVISQDQTVGELALRPWDRPHAIHFDEAGFSPIWRGDPDFVRKDREGQLWAARHAPWRLSEENRRALQAISELAHDHGFDVYLANAPLVEGLLEDGTFAEYYREAQRTLDQAVAGMPRVHRILRDPAVFPLERMQNSDHVLREATGDYTRMVAAAVAEWEESEDVDPGTRR